MLQTHRKTTASIFSYIKEGFCDLFFPPFPACLPLFVISLTRTIECTISRDDSVVVVHCNIIDINVRGCTGLSPFQSIWAHSHLPIPPALSSLSLFLSAPLSGTYVTGIPIHISVRLISSWMQIFMISFSIPFKSNPRLHRLMLLDRLKSMPLGTYLRESFLGVQQLRKIDLQHSFSHFFSRSVFIAEICLGWIFSTVRSNNASLPVHRTNLSSTFAWNREIVNRNNTVLN